MILKGKLIIFVSLQRWDFFASSVLVKVSLYLIHNYFARLFTAIVAVSLVMIGAIINISECETTSKVVSGT